LHHFGLPVSLAECRCEDTDNSKKGPPDKVPFHEKVHPHDNTLAALGLSQ
jgi:hypothetical protein